MTEKQNSLMLTVYLARMKETLAVGIQFLQKYDDEYADVATSGDITYIRLCMQDVLSAIGDVDPEKLNLE